MKLIRIVSIFALVLLLALVGAGVGCGGKGGGGEARMVNMIPEDDNNFMFMDINPHFPYQTGHRRIALW